MNIFYMSFTAGILIVAIMLLRLVAMNKLPKKTFLVLWGIVMMRLLLPVGFSIQLPGFFGRETQGQLAKLGSRLEQRAVVESIKVSEHAETIFTLHNLYLLWGCGFIVFLGIVLYRYVQEYRKLAESLPCDELIPVVRQLNRVVGVHKQIELRCSEYITSPVTYGIIKPKVVVPKYMGKNPKRQIEYMVMHELVHIRRRDVFWKMISLTALCVHWFNPMVWFMYYVFNRDQEISCDDQVLRLIGEEEREEYAMTLIQMAEQRTRTDAVCCGFGKNLIEERIVSIMKHKKATLAASICACVIVAGSFTIFANVNGSDKDKFIEMKFSEDVQESEGPEKDSEASVQEKKDGKEGSGDSVVYVTNSDNSIEMEFVGYDGEECRYLCNGEDGNSVCWSFAAED